MDRTAALAKELRDYREQTDSRIAALEAAVSKLPEPTAPLSATKAASKPATNKS